MVSPHDSNDSHHSNTLRHPQHHPRPTFDKRLFALLLIAYVALLVGCTSAGTSLTNIDYKTGTGTLALSFDSQYPPQTMTEGEQNAVVIIAKNSGGYSIPSGKLLVTTDDSVLYFGTKTAQSTNAKPINSVGLVKGNQPLYGKSIISPDGEQQSFSFDIYALPLPQESQQRSATITAYACFPYETFQHAAVCIDFDPYKTLTSSQVQTACHSQDVTVDAGGGPVNVQVVQSRFDKDSQGNILPSFYFTIQADSNLKFFALGDQDAFCDASQIIAKTHDTVYLAAYLSDQPLVCDGLQLVPGYQSTYAVPLTDSQAKVTCRTSQAIYANSNPSGPTGNYLAPLTINMTYGVVATASQYVEVKAASN